MSVNEKTPPAPFDMGEFLEQSRALVAEADFVSSIRRARRLRRACERSLTARPSAVARLRSMIGRPAFATEEVATDVGPLLLPSHDQVVLPWIRSRGCWEPEESAVFAAVLEPGMHVLDLGAHVGYYSLLAAQKVGPEGRVVAFEPDPANFSLLCANLERAGASAARPVPAAVGHTTELRVFSTSADNTGDHSFDLAAADRRHLPVPCLAIDDLLDDWPGVNLVKIDIQGADHHAIAGMLRLLRRGRPVVLVEFWPQGIRALGDDPSQVVGHYRSIAGGIRMVTDTGVVDAPNTDQDVVAAAEAHDGGFLSLLMTPDGR